MQKKLKILLTGGHAGTTALSVVEEIQNHSTKNTIRLYWIGAKSAVEGKNISTLENQTLPQLGVETHSIITGRLQRRFTAYTLPSLLKIPVGFIHSLILLCWIRPDIILSFGGFAAFPVVVMGFILRIPIILHEQTAAAGRANIFSSFFAKKVVLARDSSRTYFPKEKTIVLGNPVAKKYFDIEPKDKISVPPVLFVTGGSRGSSPLNQIVLSTIHELTKTYHVIHQTGAQDYDEVSKVRENLNEKEKKRYEVYSFVDPAKMSNLFTRADMLVSRSGANTVSQVLIAKRPTLFIPLPFAFNDEQTKNALYAKEFGIADVLPQSQMNESTFLTSISKLHKNWNAMVINAKDKKSPDVMASKKLVELILHEL